MRSAHSGICTDRLGRANLAGALIAALASCGTAPAGPAEGGTGSATPLGTTTSRTSSPTPSTTTATPTPTETALVASSEVLETTLFSKVAGKTYMLDAEDSGDYWSPAGLEISFFGEYVSGDRGCIGLFTPHDVDAAAFAYVSMSNKATAFEELVESYATVADAQKVMAENLAQAKTCRTFKMKDSGRGEVVTLKHTMTGVARGNVHKLVHHFNGSTKDWIYEFHMLESRVEGEMMHLLWASNARTDPSSAAFAQFQKVINAYRAEHPRNGSAALVSN